jgi:hypothetical protein
VRRVAFILAVASFAAAAAAATLAVVVPGADARRRPPPPRDRLPPPLDLVRFQTPSRNMACLFASQAARRPAYLRCDILTGLKPEPKRPCELDWTGLGLTVRGRAYPVCAGDTVYTRDARVLRYGERWSRGPFTCLSRRAGLRCTNARGRGFVLARARSFAF